MRHCDQQSLRWPDMLEFNRFLPVNKLFLIGGVGAESDLCGVTRPVTSALRKR